MLIAVVDCLVEAELATLVATLTRDGIVCLPSHTDICRIHETLAQQSLRPIVIYGPESMNIPVDDCPQIWLCCGPEVACDRQEATALYNVQHAELERKEKAMRCGFRCMAYVDVLCFMANAQATQCVKTMNVQGKAAEIMLRHVKRCV